MRYAGIRVLLVFVVTNTIMILMLVPSITSRHPWLAYILPGQFEPGSNYSGYWVFFSLVLLVDAFAVLGMALYVFLPGIRELVRLDADSILPRLTDRQGVSEEARNAILAEMRDELAAVRTQLFVGRFLLGMGTLFLILAFGSVTLSFARALPNSPYANMFVQDCSPQAGVCAPGGVLAPNNSVSRSEVNKFTVDQIMHGVLFGAPEVYQWRFSLYSNNPHNLVFSNFVFAFRLLLGLILVLTLVSLRIPRAEALPQPLFKDVSPAEPHDLAA